MPQEELFALTKKDRTILKGLLDAWSKGRLNTPNRFSGGQSENDVQAPEVYVARSPVGGVPAMSGSTPGSADCWVWQFLSNDLEFQQLNLFKTIWNLHDAAVDEDTWFLAVRDKFGVWWADDLLSAGGSSTYRIGDTQGHSTTIANGSSITFKGTGNASVTVNSGSGNASVTINSPFLFTRDGLGHSDSTTSSMTFLGTGAATATQSGSSGNDTLTIYAAEHFYKSGSIAEFSEPVLEVQDGTDFSFSLTNDTGNSRAVLKGINTQPRLKTGDSATSTTNTTDSITFLGHKLGDVILSYGGSLLSLTVFPSITLTNAQLSPSGTPVPTTYNNTPTITVKSDSFFGGLYTEPVATAGSGPTFYNLSLEWVGPPQLLAAASTAGGVETPLWLTVQNILLFQGTYYGRSFITGKFFFPGVHDSDTIRLYINSTAVATFVMPTGYDGPLTVEFEYQGTQGAYGNMDTYCEARGNDIKPMMQQTINAVSGMNTSTTFSMSGEAASSEFACRTGRMAIIRAGLSYLV